MDGQMKKGVLELCILGLAAQGNCYGYEIARKIQVFFPEVKESTVYAILRRLRNGQAVECFYGESCGGPPRKYYKISETGHAAYTEAMEEWRRAAQAVQGLCRIVRSQ